MPVNLPDAQTSLTRTIQYRLRKLTTNNKSGDAYGVTIPKQLTKEFKETYFYVYRKGPTIILESGAKAQRKN